MSDCTEMVTHSVHFQHQNDSKISMLIKACRSLSVKNCHAKGREVTPRMYSQLRQVDHRSWKISTVCSMLRRQNRSTFWWICDSKALCSTRQQEHFGGKIFHENKFSRAGVWLWKSLKFLSCKNFLLYGSMTSILQCWQNYIWKKLQGFGTFTSPTFQLTLSLLGWVCALDYTTPTNMGMRVSYMYVHKSQSC